MAMPVANSPRTSPDHAMLHGFHVNVKAFDAVGDGSHDDTANIQAAIDALSTTGGVLYFPKGTYKVTSKLVLPDIPSVTNPGFHVLGYGATLSATTAISIMGRRNPTSYSPDAIQMTDYRFRIEGLRFLGNSTTNQVGLDMVATFGMEITNCRFESLDIGFRGTFCLMTTINSCLAYTNKTYAFQLRSGSGIFTGATVDNSGSNHSTFTQCRDYASAAQTAQWHIRASSNVVLHDCITEGSNPVISIDWASNSSSVKFFKVVNLHSENVPSNCIIKCAGDVGGTQVFENLWVQDGTPTLIDGTGGSANNIIVKDMPWWNGNKFKGDINTAWNFNGVGQSFGSGFDPSNGANWVGGAVPSYYTCTGRGTYAGNPSENFYPLNGQYGVKGTTVVDGAFHAGSTGIIAGSPASGHWNINGLNISGTYQTEANPRAIFYLDPGTGNGGKLDFGAGGGGAPDTNLYRSAANVLKTDDQLIATDGVQTKYLSGAGKTTVVDGDFTATPPNGTIAVHFDSTGVRTYISVRSNGTWHVMAGPIV